MILSTFQQLLQDPEGVDRRRSFLQAALALSIICTLQGDEKQHSARWNRTGGAEEAIIKVCDIYLPDGLDKARLSSIMNVVDGPLADVIRRHADMLLDAVSMVELPEATC